jgi:hypothetical protein
VNERVASLRHVPGSSPVGWRACSRVTPGYQLPTTQLLHLLARTVRQVERIAPLRLLYATLTVEEVAPLNHGKPNRCFGCSCSNTPHKRVSTNVHLCNRTLDGTRSVSPGCLTFCSRSVPC